MSFRPRLGLYARISGPKLTSRPSRTVNEELKPSCGRVCLTASAQNSPASGTRSQIYFTHVTVIDTETGKEATDQTVLLTDGKVADVAKSGTLSVPASAGNVDGRGKYLIP